MAVIARGEAEYNYSHTSAINSQLHSKPRCYIYKSPGANEVCRGHSGHSLIKYELILLVRVCYFRDEYYTSVT